MMAALVLLAGLAGAAQEDPAGYLQVTGPCGLEFPRDHGAHPGYRTEWWYYTGNLQADDGRKFGFQLTIFRSQITPPGEKSVSEGPKSEWRTRQVYLGHLAVSDIGGGRHLQAENVARAALGMAGAKQQGADTVVWLHDWSVNISAARHRIAGRAAGFGVDLELSPLKPPVLHGEGGYSRKGGSAERASCYYSFTRMDAEGYLTVGEQTIPVRGLSWMDHEFSSSPLEPGIVGWDWFSLQLSDGTEIMFFLLRTDSGTLHPASSGTFVDRSGDPTHLDSDAVQVSVLDRWKSPASHAVYPSRWRIRISPLGIELTVDSRLADQEMRTTKSTGVTYWEGSASIEGKKRGEKVTGVGYVELTGYAGAFDAPI